MKKYLKYLIIGIVAVALYSLLFKHHKEEPSYSPRDYQEIKKSGVLRAVTEYNSLSFHASADSIEGFHYDLLKAFAQEKGLLLEVTPMMTIEDRLESILSGKCDILANDVLISSERKDSLLFTRPILLGKQVLLQRKPQTEDDTCFIKSQLELANKTLHVVRNSPYTYRIHNLSTEIGDTIYIKEIEKYGQEHLLPMVANGDIDYAVCDENIARASIGNFPQLDMSTAISFTQFYSWGINKRSTELLDTLNAWLEQFKQTKAFKDIKRKYYNNQSRP